jgi:transposase-like protein
MEAGAEILKVDEAGRIQTPAGKREAMLAEYDRSGMTGAQFARFVGVRYSTLMYWLQKRRKEVGGSGSRAACRQDHPRWLEARVEGEAPNSENLVVEVGGGVRILVSNRTQATLAGEVLRAIGLGGGC